LTKKGYEPRILFDWDTPVKLKSSTAKEKLNCTEAKALVERIHESWRIAQGNIARSQERYTIQANKHYCVVDFGVGNKV